MFYLKVVFLFVCFSIVKGSYKNSKLNIVKRFFRFAISMFSERPEVLPRLRPGLPDDLSLQDRVREAPSQMEIQL